MGKLIEYDYKLYILSEKAKQRPLNPKENKQFNKLIEWWNDGPGEEDILIE